MTPKEVLALCKNKGVKVVDLRFIDFPGMTQHFTIPVGALEEESFTEGVGFDGSSIRGWQTINESDMLVVPVSETAFIDPFSEVPTLVLLCDIKDPITKKDYSRDPRNVARKAVEYMKKLGVADTCYIGPELEFFVFDSIRYDQASNEGYYHIDSVEGRWNMGAEGSCSGCDPNLGFKIRHKEGYFPTPPSDTLQDIRNEMMLQLIEAGVPIEAQHHEVATAGQCEIDMRFRDLVTMGDCVVKYKYIVKMVARKRGKVACFMPKPLFQDNGSGMHTHFSLWKKEKPLFSGSKYAGLSDIALHAIGGVLKHAKALLAFCAPTTNSYKRLVPGYEAPVNLAYSKRNRSAACRIPMYSESPKAKRVEFRCPDPSSNPYLAFSAILMAALDGIHSKTDPGQPLDKDLYDLEEHEMKKVPQTTGSLDASLDALEKDHAFLTKGDVFTDDVIETWLHYKRLSEVDAIRLRPHPYEFVLYGDI
jgi:glutamine synthetase